MCPTGFVRLICQVVSWPPLRSCPCSPVMSDWSSSFKIVCQSGKYGQKMLHVLSLVSFNIFLFYCFGSCLFSVLPSFESLICLNSFKCRPLFSTSTPSQINLSTHITNIVHWGVHLSVCICTQRAASTYTSHAYVYLNVHDKG